MATRGIFTATELVPLLRERGIDLSASQVHRLVSGTPERLSLQVLSAFCDILGCTPADLVTTTLGGFDPVRRGGDTEFTLRLQTAFGPRAVRRPGPRHLHLPAGGQSLRHSSEDGDD